MTTPSGKVRKVTSLRQDEPSYERFITIKGQQYKITIEDFEGGKWKPVRVPGETRSFTARMNTILDKCTKSLQDTVVKMEEGDQFQIETDLGSNELLAFRTKIKAKSQLTLTDLKVDEVFDSTVDKDGIEKVVSEFNQSTQVLTKPTTSSKTPDSDDSDDDTDSGYSLPTNKIARSFPRFQWSDPVVIASGSKKGQQDLLGAIDAQSKAINKDIVDGGGTAPANQDPKDAIVATLKDLSAKVKDHDDPDTNTGVDQAIEGIKYGSLIVTNKMNKGIDTAGRDVVVASLKKPAKDLTKVEKQQLLALYENYIAGGGNHLHPRVICYFCSLGLNKNIVLFDNTTPTPTPVFLCSGKEEAEIDTRKTIILHAIGEPTSVRQIRSGVGFRSSPKVQSAPVNIPGSNLTDRIKDCGGGGNCGPLSIQDQLNRLSGIKSTSVSTAADATDSTKGARAKEVRKTVVDYLTKDQNAILAAYRKDQADAAAKKLADEPLEPSSPLSLIFSRIEVNSRDALNAGAIPSTDATNVRTWLASLGKKPKDVVAAAQSTVTKSDAPAMEKAKVDALAALKQEQEAAQIALFTFYVGYIGRDGTFIDSAFLRVFVAAVRAEDGANKDFQIVIVRPKIDGSGYEIEEVFPEDGPIDPNKTIFLEYDGKRTGGGIHYRSVNSPKSTISADHVDTSLKELLIKRDQLAFSGNLEVFRDFTLPNHYIENHLADLFDRSPVIHEAIGRVAFDVANAESGGSLAIAESDPAQQLIYAHDRIIRGSAYYRNPPRGFEAAVHKKIAELHD